jgi:hypothetical protein
MEKKIQGSRMKGFKERQELTSAQRAGMPLREIFLRLFFSDFLISQECFSLQKELFTLKERILKDREKHFENILLPSEEKELEVSLIFSKYCLLPYKTITEELIQELNDCLLSFLILDHLNSLNRETALALSLFQGEYLSLNSIRTLLPESIQGIHWGKKSSFDKRYSKKYFKVVLNGLEEIEEESAEILTQDCLIRNVYLEGLRDLKDSFILSFCESNKIQNLNLNGIQKLDKNQAEKLSRFKGIGLELDGLKSLDQKVAEKLFQFQDHFYFISLNGLVQLEKGVAEAFSLWNPKHFQRTHPFSSRILLSGLSVLESKDLEALRRWKGLSLCLNGLKELKPEIWRFLSQLPLRELQLKALECLDLEIASSSILSEMKLRILNLDGLKELEPEVVRELTKSNVDVLFLNGLRKLKPELAEAFGGFLKEKREIYHTPSLYLNEIEEIDEETSKIVSQWEGRYIYLGLKELKAETAKILSEWKGKDEYTYNNTLYLDKLEHLEPEIAQILFQSSDSESTSSSYPSIKLNGLRVLDEKLARILIQSKRSCSLKGIKYLETEVKKIFGASDTRRFSFSEEISKQIEVYDLRKQEEERLKKEREEEQKKVWIRFESLTKEEQEKELIRMAEESSAQNNLEGEDE